MFELMTDPTFTARVTMTVPAQNQPRRVRFRAEFRYIDQQRIDALLTGDSDVDSSLMDEVLTGWSGLVDAAGAAVEYTEENRQQALGMPFFRAALLRAFFEGINGQQTKN